MLKQIIAAREAAGKHPFPPEHLSVDEVREVVSRPDFIEASVSHPHRELYYTESKTEENPFARVVVDYKGCDNRGIAVSWSRYKHTAQTVERIWTREG